MTRSGARGAINSPLSASFCVTMPPAGASTVASFMAFSSVAILRVDAGEPRAGRVDFFPPGAGLQPRDGFRGGPHPFLSCADAVVRHVPPRRGIVSRLLRAGVGGEQVLEALQVALGGGQLLAGARDVGLGCGALGFGLADVFLAGAGEQQAELGVGALAFRRGPPEGQCDVGRVELGDDVARLHAVALGHLQVDQPPAHFRRDADLRGLDVSGHADAVGRRLVAAARGRERSCAQGEGGDAGDRRGTDAVLSHDISPVGPASAAAGMTACRLSIWRCAMKRSGSSRPTSNWATRARALRIGVVAR